MVFFNVMIKYKGSGSRKDRKNTLHQWRRSRKEVSGFVFS